MVGDASVGGDRTAGMDQPLAVPNRERGALRGCRIPFGVPLPAAANGSDRSSDRRRSHLGRAGVHGEVVRDITNRRTTLHRSRWRVGRGHGDGDVPGAGRPVRLVGGAFSDFLEASARRCPGLRLSSGPVGDAYTSKAAASRTGGRVGDPVEDPGVLEAWGRVHLPPLAIVLGAIVVSLGAVLLDDQVDQGTKIGDVVGAGHFHHSFFNPVRSRRPGCGGLGGSPGCGRCRCLRRLEPGGVGR